MQAYYKTHYLVKRGDKAVDNHHMNNIVILNASVLGPYADEDLGFGKTSIDYAVEAVSLMPGNPYLAIILPEEGISYTGFPSDAKVLKSAGGAVSLVDSLAKLSEGYDNIIYYCADCSLIDNTLAERMYGNHIKYFSEYTFADGYPAGLTVEIIRRTILPSLSELAKKNDAPVERNTIFSLVEKDINSFDIETEISPDDQRLLRVSLFPDTKRNFVQVKSLIGKVADESGNLPRHELAEKALKIVRRDGEFLRSLPVFFEIETTAGRPQPVSYFPDGEGGGEQIELDNFRAILEKIAGFCGDAVISLSVRNEPSLHSSPERLAEAVLGYPEFRLLIETSGLGWRREQIDRINNIDPSRTTWIIDLDALDRCLYEKLRGPGWEDAYKFAADMVETSPDNTWVQAVRMQENEIDTEKFFKYWKERTNNVIIQKYDWCCGRLPMRKVTDLSPVRRLPCWHLKREMVILRDGTVPLCRDDLRREAVLGNINDDDIRSIWENGHNYYKLHLNEEYPELCRNCDEYYTYNY